MGPADRPIRFTDDDGGVKAAVWWTLASLLTAFALFLWFAYQFMLRYGSCGFCYYLQFSWGIFLCLVAAAVLGTLGARRHWGRG